MQGNLWQAGDNRGSSDSHLRSIWSRAGLMGFAFDTQRLESPGPRRSVHVNQKVRWSLPQQISNAIIKPVNSVTPANVFQRYFETVIWSYCFHPRALPALPCCILYYLRPRGQSKLLLFVHDQKLHLERELRVSRPHHFLESFLNLQSAKALLEGWLQNNQKHKLHFCLQSAAPFHHTKKKAKPQSKAISDSAVC